ncbi:MAG: hypothetical protein E7264_09425 [Lachnospiraceae bacterium]|nr:hypothetical protein [Lachnospiraceae bacterium]
MGKKSMFKWLMICTFGMLLTTFFSYQKVNAQTVLETDVTEASDGCIFLGVYGSYHSQAQEALDRINEIRKEACEAGNVPDPRKSSRMLTSSDYVPIKWSADLESIARIRAVEAGLTVTFMGSGHNRMNDKDWSSVIYNGVKTSSEVLAYSDSTSMVDGIDLWYEEKSDWVNQVPNAMTGHYESMINPNYTYVGLGDFYTEAAKYPNTLAGEFSDTSKVISQTMQTTPTNVMQKIEVKKSYVKGYALEGTDTIYTDKTTTLTAIAILTNGVETHRLWVLDDMTYISSEPSVASVSSSGVVTGLKNGTTTITAKVGNTVLASHAISVKCNHPKELVSETAPTCTKTGVKVYSCETCGGALEQEIAMKPHNYKYGDADAEGYRTGTCLDCSDSIRIIPPTNMKLWWGHGTSEGASYSSVFPASNPIGSTIYCWIADVDGDSVYQDMVMHTTDQSVITVPEKPVANFEWNQLNVVGAGITTITIYPRYNPDLKRSVIVRVGDIGSVDFSVADITLSQTAFEYTGVACTPTVAVSYHDTMLTDGKDYNIFYENNTEVGVASVVIKGCGIFSGTIRKNYTIGHCEHTFGEWQILQEATCVTQGEKRRQCSKCKDYETEDTDVIAHQYTNGVCTGCGDILYASIDGLTYTIIETDGELFAVCVKAQEGVALEGTVNIPSTVALGGKTYTVTSVAEGAFAGQEAITEVTIPSSVTEIKGQALAGCSNLTCLKFFGEVAPIVADDVLEGVTGVAIVTSENATGYDTLAETLGATLQVEHVHDMDCYEAVEAGCTTSGNVTYYVCNVCKDTFADEFGNVRITIDDIVVNAKGHMWNSDYTIDIPATATTDGVKSIHCSGCNAKKDEVVIPATGTTGGDSGNGSDSGNGNGTGGDSGNGSGSGSDSGNGSGSGSDSGNGNGSDSGNGSGSGGDSGNGTGSGNGSGSDSNNSNDSDNNDNSGTGGNGSSDQDSNDATQAYLPTGVLFEVNGARYKVTEADTKTRTFSVSLVKVLSKKVKTFKVPSSVTYNGASYKVVTIGKKAFSGCKKLKKLTLGSNVKTISDRAFYSCSVLKSITIPSSVTKIGKEAFAKCKKLSSIKIKSNNLTAGKIGKNAFKGIKSNATFKVPKKKMKAYKAMLKKKGVGKKAKFKKL